MFKTSTLRPGFLVSLKTSVVGNASYDRRNIENDHLTEAGTRRMKWETERTIQDPVEHERALEVRQKANYLVRIICARSAFGLLCPENKAPELEKAIAEARLLADEFNSTATLTQVRIYVMTGRIAPDDVEAVKAINSEVRDLLEEMQEGVGGMDVKRIRDAANRAKQLGSMLTIDAASRIQVAIDAARTAAKRIVAAGESAAQEVDRRTMQMIAESRTAFLDIDEGLDVRAPQAQARSIDLETTGIAVNRAAVAQPKLEI